MSDSLDIDASSEIHATFPPRRVYFSIFLSASRTASNAGGGGSSNLSASPVMGCSSSIDFECRNNAPPGLAFFLDRAVPVPTDPLSVSDEEAKKIVTKYYQRDHGDVWEKEYNKNCDLLWIWRKIPDECPHKV